MIEGKMFLTEKVENKERRFGSNAEYYPVMIDCGEGNEAPALFTMHQIQEAVERGRINPEDIPERKTLLESIFGNLFG